MSTSIDSAFYERVDATLKRLGPNTLSSLAAPRVYVGSTIRDAMFRDYLPVCCDCTGEHRIRLPRSNHDASLLVIKHYWVGFQARRVYQSPQRGVTSTPPNNSLDRSAGAPLNCMLTRVVANRRAGQLWRWALLLLYGDTTIESRMRMTFYKLCSSLRAWLVFGASPLSLAKR